jgi:hypothetical protein
MFPVHSIPWIVQLLHPGLSLFPRRLGWHFCFTLVDVQQNNRLLSYRLESEDPLKDGPSPMLSHVARLAWPGAR